MNSKKKLKDEYKHKKIRMGVFQIRNTINGKLYVGGSLNLDAIWNRNRAELNFGNHRNVVLQVEWKEYGEENFKYEILGEIEQRDGDKINYTSEIKILEEMFIEELEPIYNRI
jgi:hypothetical protein